jgi:hypothetical protein
MEARLFEDLAPESKAQTIREMAIKVDTMIYAKPLSEDDLDFHYKELGNTVIRKDAVERELEEIKQEFKDKAAPLKAKVGEHMKAIRNKSLEIEGEVFVIIDEETKMAGYYDIEGNLVSSRRALPEELSGMEINMQRAM